MFSCSTCGKKISFQSVLLNEDLAANTVGFCSPACQNAWYVTLFSASPPPSEAVVARAPAALLSPRRITAFDVLRSAARRLAERSNIARLQTLQRCGALALLLRAQRRPIPKKHVAIRVAQPFGTRK